MASKRPNVTKNKEKRAVRIVHLTVNQNLVSQIYNTSSSASANTAENNQTVSYDNISTIGTFSFSANPLFLICVTFF